MAQEVVAVVAVQALAAKQAALVNRVELVMLPPPVMNMK